MSEILTKARHAMAGEGLDILIASSPENVAYLGGVSPPSQRTVRSRHAFTIIPIEGPTHYVVIQLEADTIRNRVTADELRIYQEFIENPIDVTAELVETLGAASERIGIETAHLPARDVDRLRERLPNAKLKAVDEELSDLRTIKTADEIATIRHIGAVAEKAAATAVTEASVGVTERSIANRITELYTGGGGEQLTMLVVGAGERSAQPNAPATNRVIEDGEVIRIDVIGTMNNYYSDVARTAVAGIPTDEQTRIWAVLTSIKERAIEALRPGVLTSDVYRLYSDLMDESGLPKYHFLGHGLGITLHEEPFLSGTSDVRLREGMVMCVEPLCLFSERFGMQIEDEVLITSDGCEPLTYGGRLWRVGEAT